MKHLKIISLLLVLLSLSACEKVSLEELQGNDGKGNAGGGNNGTSGDASITINVDGVESLAYSGQETAQSDVPLDDVCTRVTVALYQNGERIFYKNQKSTDSGFGTVKLNVPNGEYSLLVLGYSNKDAATSTNLLKIAFGGKVTDTFRYYENISLASGNNNNLDILLKRIVGMFRLVIKDKIPENVKQLKFYYTGGSSTLDGQTGYGCVNSRQTEYRNVTGTETSFDVYTFPHEEPKPMKFTVTALDTSGNTICEKVFENVSVTTNYITVYTGDFFNASETSKEVTANIRVDNSWTGSTDNRY